MAVLEKGDLGILNVVISSVFDTSVSLTDCCSSECTREEIQSFYSYPDYLVLPLNFFIS